MPIQETHTKDDEDISFRGCTSGFSIVATIHGSVFVIATYVRSDLDQIKFSSGSTHDNISSNFRLK